VADISLTPLFTSARALRYLCWLLVIWLLWLRGGRRDPRWA